MANADQSLWVVQNGEIYNFDELRYELIQAGFAFRSNCDTEVLIYAYAYWGVEFVRYLRGMFAIALWDGKLEKLLLARDRFGIKPLCYCVERQNGSLRLLFASEIKPILAVQSVSPQPNLSVVYDFLSQGLLDHTYETFFQGIYKIPSAHYMVIDRQGQIQLSRYWDFEVNPDVGNASKEKDRRTADSFREVFLNSVWYHLVSDVPVGSCLSGGLDSSAVVCAANHLLRARDARTPTSEHISTFTSCFEDPRYDERRYAEEVVEKTEAIAHFTFPKPEGFIEELPQLLHYQEEPFAGTSIYAQWCLMRDIHQSGLKVVLDGQGGDETLLGYGKFYLFYLQWLAQQGRYRTFLHEAMSVSLSPKFWRGLDLKHGFRYMGRFSELTGEGNLVNSSLRVQFADRQPKVGLSDDLASRIKLDITKYSLPVLLRYEDKNSMAFSVESRVPFVDHVLVEQVAALPLNQKLRKGVTKFVLREGLKGLLPEAIYRRRSKMGFVTPEDVWFRGVLAPEMERTFMTAHFLPEWADLSRLKEAFALYRKGRSLLSRSVFFRYFIMEKWARMFLEGSLGS
jgi:asparagine synthase (glutamine-hydrolysing)